MNIITLCGRLGGNAEKKILPSGQSVLNLILATNTQKAGVKETIWWKVSIWGDRFKAMEPYLKRGTAVIVTGTMHYPRIYRNVDGVDGKNHISLEVTAHNIKFSPFAGLAEEATGGVQNLKEAVKSTQQGQNSDDLSEVFNEKHAFKEDEMPF